MDKIQSLILYRLSNTSYKVFMAKLKDLIEALGATELNVEEVFVEFCECLDGLSAAIVGKRGSVLTQELLQIDKQRLKTWSAIRGRLKNTLACPIETEQEAAAILLYAAKKADKVRIMEYTGKTFVLRIVCEKLLDITNAPLCGKLGLKHWVEALQNENNFFNEQRLNRSAENAFKDAGSVANARLRLDAAYVNLIARINAMVDLGLVNSATEEFILLTNNDIKKMKALQAWRKSMRAGKKKRELEKLAKKDGEVVGSENR